MNARFYTPGTGTFASRDSIDDPLSRNRYGYGGANPLRYTDPSGHGSIGCGAGIVAGGVLGFYLGGAAAGLVGGGSLATGPGAVVGVPLAATLPFVGTAGGAVVGCIGLSALEETMTQPGPSGSGGRIGPEVAGMTIGGVGIAGWFFFGRDDDSDSESEYDGPATSAPKGPANRSQPCFMNMICKRPGGAPPSGTPETAPPGAPEPRTPTPPEPPSCVSMECLLEKDQRAPCHVPTPDEPGEVIPGIEIVDGNSPYSARRHNEDQTSVVRGAPSSDSIARTIVPTIGNSGVDSAPKGSHASSFTGGCAPASAINRAAMSTEPGPRGSLSSGIADGIVACRAPEPTTSGADQGGGHGSGRTSIGAGFEDDDEDAEKASSSSRVAHVVRMTERWLGPNVRMITNRAGDKIFLAENGLKRIRFDIRNPAPHLSPHAHVEEFVNGRWIRSGPIFPKDVFPK